MIVHCEGCRVKVAEIASGSKVKKGAVMLCPACEVKRKASDLANKSRPTDLFDGIFGRTL